MKDIKTKPAIKDIKVLDKATDVSRRAKNAYIRTKEQAERLGHNEDSNYGRCLKQRPGWCRNRCPQSRTYR